MQHTGQGTAKIRYDTGEELSAPLFFVRPYFPGLLFHCSSGFESQILTHHVFLAICVEPQGLFSHIYVQAAVHVANYLTEVLTWRVIINDMCRIKTSEEFKFELFSECA